MDDLKLALKQLGKEKSRDPEGFNNELFKEEVAGDDLPGDKHGVLGGELHIDPGVEAGQHLPDLRLATLGVRVQHELQAGGGLEEIQSEM